MGVKENYRGLEPLPEDIREKIKDLKEVFKSKNVKLAYIFGSFLTSDKPEDIDLAVLFDGDYFDLLEEIKNCLGTERVDLVDISNASPFFILDILRRGKLIYSRNNEIENSFEMKILRDVCDFEIIQRKYMEVLKNKVGL